MKLQILSFSGESFRHEQVISVTLMTGVGEITVLDKHSPLLTSIRPSTMYVVYRDENNVEIRDDFAVGSGVVEVRNSEVKILADMLVDIEDLDRERAERAKQEALNLMQKYKDSKDKMDMEKFIEAEDMLLKSIAQLKLYDMKR